MGIEPADFGNQNVDQSIARTRVRSIKPKSQYWANQECSFHVVENGKEVFAVFSKVVDGKLWRVGRGRH